MSSTGQKKMIIFADLFAGVGDRAVAWLESLKDKGPTMKPLVFYHAVDPRDHFYTIAKVRLQQTAMAHFQSERLNIPGCFVRDVQRDCTPCDLA